ncbi:ABC transporter substrate-binding protein [uncultured Senegalimassilia sp.]|uniref:ABC transporter substrate-binding protein n=1 Tax=uncultured Senegalimassilia sp. TaxID=1714350 RepID=UPI002601E23C|nr:ABC transporter substrate-binding protein [uncultured Senegalimassilia sp.]
MKSFSRRTFLQVAGVSAAAVGFGGVLSACAGGSNAGSGSAASGEHASQVTVSMPVSSEPDAGFDPFVSWGCGEHVHEPLIQSTLLTTKADMGFENDLATAYSCSDDGLTWTFTIRTDAKFTNGKPVTAHDVAYTINGVANNEASECDLTMVDKAVAVDDETCEVHLNKPFNALLYTLAVIGIVPDGGHDADYGSNPVGSGRYMLEQWDRGQQVILKANPDYYGEAPKIERVVVVFMEEDASLAAARSGQVDVAFTTATFADQQPKGYDLLNCASVDSRGISLPTIAPGATKKQTGEEYPAGNAVTQDLALRRAINYGVKRQTLIDNVLNGYGQIAYSVGDNMPWSSDAMKCEEDLARAKALLDEAGWVAGADGVRAKDGVTAAFDLYYAASDSVRQAIAMEFTNQMSELGIKVTPKGASWDDITKHQFSDPVVWGWGSNSPIEVYNLNYSAANGNYACYKNAAVDAHLDAALANPVIADSYDEWKLAMWDGENGPAPQGDATWVWFANIDHLYFVAEGLKVAEQKPHPHGHGWSIVNNVDKWSW